MPPPEEQWTPDMIATGLRELDAILTALEEAVDAELDAPTEEPTL